jgi:uncharacterized repeat protein (TIGR01451 family)
MFKSGKSCLDPVLLGLVVGLISATNAFAAANVMAGTASASADTAADATATIPSFTGISTITIAESTFVVFAQTGTTYTLTFTAPSGWTFDLGGADPSVTKNGGASDITDPTINRVDSNNITIVFTTDDVRDSLDTLTITGIRVQPITGLGLATNYITVTSSGVIFPGFSSTNVAALIKTVGAASALAFGVQPSDTATATFFTPATTVRILDHFGNVTADSSSVVLALGNNPGGGTLSGTRTNAAVNGTATFNNLSLDKAGAGYTLLASSGTLSGTNSVAFNVTNGPATLVITTAPQTLTAGSISGLITVELQNEAGVPITTAVNRTINLITSSAGGVFRNAADTVNITNVIIPAGASSVNYLYRDTIAGNPIITNTTPLLIAATQTETVVAAAASKLVVVTQPSATAIAGVAFPIQPQVRVTDPFGNLVASFGSAITVAQTAGGSLNASPTAPTAAPVSGVATFSGLFITNGGINTLTFTAPGVIGTNSAAINVGGGAPIKIRVETLANGTGTVVPAQNVTSGLSVTNFAITRDIYGNFVSNVAASSWSLLNIDGGVMSVDLAPAADNKSAVFTGRLLGSANVHVTSGVLPITDPGMFTVVQGTNDADLPGASAHFRVIPAGSWVIAMDNTNQNLIAPFNLKSYGLVNHLLQNYIPVSWAIRAGKPKDGIDFSAPAFRMSPSMTGTSTLHFAGGPFIIHRDYTNLARPHITAFGNNVAVYELTSNAVVDIRHELQFQPSISVNFVNAYIHANLLGYASITNYTVTSDYNLSSNTCFTFFLEPHNTDPVGVPSARNFIQSGGNFLAQCAAVATYENAAAGHFQCTSNIFTANTNTSFTYLNPDLPYGQFIGNVIPTLTAAVQDWTLGGGTFVNDGHSHLLNTGLSPARYTATSSKHSVGPGGMLFYLGGHDYYEGSPSYLNDITRVNGMRMLLNAVFVPANRPTCGLNFTANLAITKSDSVHTVTNGQSVTYTIVVANQGFQQVNGATVTDDIGPSLTNVTWTSSVTGGATNFNPSGTGSISATVNLPVYGTVTFTMQATIASGAACLVTNIAIVAPPKYLFEINTNNNVAVDVDHVMPLFSAPPDLLLSCTNQTPAAATNVAGFIAAGGNIENSAIPTTLIHMGDISNSGAGSPSSPLIISRTYRLTTDCGDSADRIQTVTVVDNQPPAISCPANVSVSTARGASTVTNVALGTPIVSDNCAVVSVTNNAPSEFPAGTNIVTWTVMDSAGLNNSCQQRVVVHLNCSGVLNTSALSNLTRCAHDPALFQVTASSPDPISYAWRYNGQSLAGETSNSLLLASPETNHSGVYSVEIRTPCRAITNSATLMVLPLPAGSPVTYSNNAVTTIPMVGAANPYPSVITLQCVPGVVKKITATLYGYTHTFPSDVNVLLVSPDGRKVVLMGGAGDTVTAGGANLTFADTASQPVPFSGTVASGTYRPGTYTPGVAFSAPAPSGPFATNLATFIGAAPNGAWKLFVYDDVSGDAGSISRWTLTLEWAIEGPLFLARPRMQINGTRAMDVWGRTGVPTIIERSANLTNWIPISTNVYGVSPSVFVDPRTPPSPPLFYRALQP